MKYEFIVIDFCSDLFESVKLDPNWKTSANIQFIFDEAIADKIDVDADRLGCYVLLGAVWAEGWGGCVMG